VGGVAPPTKPPLIRTDVTYYLNSRQEGKIQSIQAVIKMPQLLRSAINPNIFMRRRRVIDGKNRHLP
jgi:hypothetical protein